MFDRPTYVNAIMRFADAPMIKVITGIRRSGKSTILLMLIEELRKRGIPSERILSYRFDSMKYDGLTAKALYGMLLAAITHDQKTYIFLDEIQEIAGWEKVVNSLMQEEDVDPQSKAQRQPCAQWCSRPRSSTRRCLFRRPGHSARPDNG